MPKFHAAIIQEKTRETADSVVLTVTVPDAAAGEFEYRQGQHLPVRAELGGKSVRRTYSICASVADETLRLGIRIQDGGLFSNHVADDLDVGDTLDELQANPWFKGVRHIWHDEPDDDWLARTGPVNGLREVAARGLAYDFLVRPQHLKYVPEIMDKVPDLRSVIDHIAKPLIAEKVVEPWLEDLREVANIPGMMCKVSGMVTEADMENWTPDDLAPYVAHVLGMFGYDRLMYGSDWPVCLQGGSYQQVIDAARKTLSSLTAEESSAVFGGNAARFYRLD